MRRKTKESFGDITYEITDNCLNDLFALSERVYKKFGEEDREAIEFAREIHDIKNRMDALVSIADRFHRRREY